MNHALLDHLQKLHDFYVRENVPYFPMPKLLERIRAGNLPEGNWVLRSETMVHPITKGCLFTVLVEYEYIGQYLSRVIDRSGKVYLRVFGEPTKFQGSDGTVLHLEANPGWEE